VHSSEQLAYHHHVLLAIFINGQPRSVPLAIGMVPPVILTNAPGGQFAGGSDTCLYWIHVHAQDGIIHLESPQPGNFLLAQFFDIWHQAIWETRIGRYTGKVTATVNGKTWPGDPSKIPLAEHTQIVLNLGGPAVSPPPVNWKATQL
jgi:hypothetical protein